MSDPESWRNEPLTKGEMHDALMAAADSVEANVKKLKESFKIVPGFSRLAKPVVALTVDILTETAETISKEGK